MIKIKGYQKLVGKVLHPNYSVLHVSEDDRFYDFIISNNVTANTCIIGLRRDSLSSYEGKRTYEILYNGRDIRNSVTKDWIVDKDNMLIQMEGILSDYPC
jgi:hypothetical protein